MAQKVIFVRAPADFHKKVAITARELDKTIGQLALEALQLMLRCSEQEVAESKAAK